MGPDGVFYFGDDTGDGAFAALQTAIAQGAEKRVELRADGDAPANRLAQVMARLTAAGATQVDLAVAVR
ncbi:ExbD/TolR family protein [Aquicoccus sp. G2-2]|uniref:ExbD/TolR family protein n=1 Tax=Aquicoccus sp. G2-2 TaxID=3092120 RepID=UPI00366F31E3